MSDFNIPSGKQKLIYICFFLSGSTALIYQLLWARLLGLVIGNTMYAISLVLASFMAGLAPGPGPHGTADIDLVAPRRHERIAGAVALGDDSETGGLPQFREVVGHPGCKRRGEHGNGRLLVPRQLGLQALH